MKELDNKEIKQILLDTLIHFHNFCEENNLQYFLNSGTLLGAIRHKGFIPWDDDIDVIMPRADYERFRDLYPKVNKVGNYVLHDHKTDNQYAYPFLKLSDEHTICNGGGKDEISPMGLFIDIFPLDGMPKDSGSLRRHMKRCAYIRKFLLLAALHVGIAGRRLVKSTLLRIFKCLPHGNSPQYWNNKLEKMAMQYSLEGSTYAGNAVWGNIDCQNVLASAYFKPILVSFEGHQFWGMEDYDHYLTTCYGNYMTPPPVEQQRGIHIAHCYYKD